MVVTDKKMHFPLKLKSRAVSEEKVGESDESEVMFHHIFLKFRLTDIDDFMSLI